MTTKSPHHLNSAQAADLMRVANSGAVGTESAFPCNVDPRDTVRVRRVGLAKARLRARVGVLIGQSPTNGRTAYIAAPEARALAASLLNAADEIDGVTPLTFHTPDPDEVPRAVAAVLAEVEQRVRHTFEDSEEILAVLREAGGVE